MLNRTKNRLLSITKHQLHIETLIIKIYSKQGINAGCIQVIEEKLQAQLLAAKKNINNAIETAKLSAMHQQSNHDAIAGDIANFLHLCDVIEVSFTAGILLIFAYEKGTICLDDVKNLLHIPEDKKISMADYFRKKQVIGEQTLQDFFIIEQNPNIKTEKCYSLSISGRIAAQTLHGAFS